MKKMKKILAMLLALTMVLGTSLTSFAANDETTPVITIDRKDENENKVYDVNENGVPEATDSTTVTITGITGLENAPTITLYQIAKGTYGDGEKEFIEYNFAPGVTFAKKTQPTASEIVDIANGILSQSDDIIPWGEVEDEYDSVELISTNTDGLKNYTYTATVNAGMYIAIITGADDGAVYNPILLSAYYNDASNLVPGQGDDNPEVDDPEVDVNDTYLFGTNALAKKTTASIEKNIVGGTTEDGITTESGEEVKDTVTVGDVVEYELEVTVPSYPQAAVNKTFFVSDTMSDGLTFDYSSLKVKIDGTNYTATLDGNVLSYTVDGNTTVELAKAEKTTDGFNINFNYDTLISNTKTGAVYPTITISYSALVNGEAVVGTEGNPNQATLYYTNTPNQGGTWEPVNKVPEGNGFKTDTDEEIVYTYQLAFLKTGEGAEASKLANAVFGIYTDTSCAAKYLIDTVTTNANGYGVSTKVEAGTYYIKEIEAPDGYSLNTKTYQITATWTTATTTNKKTDTTIEYSPEVNGQQVGWLNAAGKFFDMYSKPVGEDGVDVFPAYIKSTTSKTDTSSTTLDKKEGCAGTATELIEVGKTENGGKVSAITNTKLIALPSTGGIGTTIFTVAGCGIMIAAAFFFFASRKKENE